MSQLRVAGATLNQTPLDWEGNLKNIVDVIQVAKEAQVNLLCLPELCITGYGCEDTFLSEWLYKKALEQLKKIVKETEDIAVFLGIPVIYQNDKYNCAVLVENQEIKGFTAKQFLALDGVHYEPRWFKAWKATELVGLEIDGQKYPFGDLQYEVKGVKIGVEVCEDAWHEELRPAHQHCAIGVDLILSLNASHFAFEKSVKRQKLITNITEEYEVAYLYVNLLGNEAGRMIYDGEIMAFHNDKFLFQNKRFSYKNFNLASILFDFENPQNSKSEQVWEIDPENKNKDFVAAESIALFDYMRKSRSKGFVLSLSGGADSSTCAVLVAESIKNGIEELGLENFARKAGVFSEKEIKNILESENPLIEINAALLTCVYQAAASSSDETLESAKILAESINATFFDWNIGQEVATYTEKIENALQRKLTWKTDDIALQNIQARTRAPIVWMMTNIKNALLIATSNRSEGSVGYATMDGDTSGGLSPIAGVDKHFIRDWLVWAEKELDYTGLAPVNQLAPSAELRPQELHQTDETDLMPYQILVAIENLAIGKYYSPKQVFEELKDKNLEDEQLLKAHVKKFFQLWSRNQWKRERIAPSFHLDDYNVDPRSWYRFPILSGAFKEELASL